MPGIGHQLKESIFAVFPHLAGTYLLSALAHERSIAGSLMRSESLVEAKIVVGNQCINAESLSHRTLIPSRQFVDGQQIAARRIRRLHCFGDGKILVAGILTAVCTACQGQHSGKQDELRINRPTAADLCQHVRSIERCRVGKQSVEIRRYFLTLDGVLKHPTFERFTQNHHAILAFRTFVARRLRACVEPCIDLGAHFVGKLLAAINPIEQHTAENRVDRRHTRAKISLLTSVVVRLIIAAFGNSRHRQCDRANRQCGQIERKALLFLLDFQIKRYA